MKYVFLVSLVALMLGSCTQENENASGLPVFGVKLPITKEVNGKTVVDSLEHTIPPFSFVDQDSAIVTEKTVEGKVYLADFFFTSCFTICPKVKKNMKKAYKAFKGRSDFAILSHSIDTRHDTVGRLAWYANKFDISSDTWHLLTGDKEAIYKIAYDYYVTALESADAPGGFDHSGAVVLVDKKRRIRGMYDGTDPERMKQLVKDTQLLLDTE
ncbi:MAG: Electron transport protein sco1/senc [uncultured Aureispira sp.]|uniref:Electron transport protein sco1/senc n=1 Tax=uncultured Aureispira sp. TaxID=1331704 RepID=A0A6S6S4Q9_9BACT|nr:MAG: Electron transport protein sco1/senc [uncultured Aureispira sp.]